MEHLNSKCDLILVAGGSGSRFCDEGGGSAGGSPPKQFEVVQGKPVYRWSLDVFGAWSQAGKIVLVIPQKNIGTPISENSFLNSIQVVRGGPSRQISATLGLKALDLVSQNPWVMVHDAARPCLTYELLNRLWEAKNGDPEALAVVPGLPLRETVKVVANGQVRETLPRQTLFSIQTPQLLRKDVLRNAYETFSSEGATDDSSLIEKLGFKVIVVPGEYDNLKLTFREDINRVSDWLRQRHP